MFWYETLVWIDLHVFLVFCIFQRETTLITPLQMEMILIRKIGIAFEVRLFQLNYQCD